MNFSEAIGKTIFKRMSEREITIYNLSSETLFTCDDILGICCGKVILSPKDVELIAQVLGTTKKELIETAYKGDWCIISKGEYPEISDEDLLLLIEDGDSDNPYHYEIGYYRGLEGNNNEPMFDNTYHGWVQGNIIAWQKLPKYYKNNNDIFNIKPEFKLKENIIQIEDRECYPLPINSSLRDLVNNNIIELSRQVALKNAMEKTELKLEEELGIKNSQKG